MIYTYRTAAVWVMPIGKHRGKTLDAIATRDDGLQYLAWLRDRYTAGARTRTPSPAERDTLNALSAYLDDPTIKAELNKL